MGSRYWHYFRQKVTPDDLNNNDNFGLQFTSEVAKMAGNGIFSGGDVTPQSPTTRYVNIAATSAFNTSGSEVIIPGTVVVDTLVDENSNDMSVTTGNERYVSIFVSWNATTVSTRVDGYGATVDYQVDDSYQIKVADGGVYTTGNAVPAALRPGSILLADILVQSSGVVAAGQISTTRVQQLVTKTTGLGSINEKTYPDAIAALATLANNADTAITTAYQAADTAMQAAYQTADHKLNSEIQNIKLHNLLQATPANSFTGTFHGAAFNTSTNNYIIVGSSAEIQTSPTGKIWTHRTAANSYTGIFYGVCANPSGTSIAVGTAGEIQLSADGGATWAHKTADNSYGSFAGQDFQAVCFGNSLFVAVGRAGEIQLSTDNGATWAHKTADASYTGDFRAVTYGNGLYIAAGDSGEVQTSPDGTTWTHRASLGFHVYGVVYANGVYSAVGYLGDVAYSYDGINWVAPLSLAFTNLNAITTLGDGTFVAAGASGQIYTTPDGINWRSVTGTFTTTLYGAACADVNFVAGSYGNIDMSSYLFVGANGIILKSNAAELQNQITTIQNDVTTAESLMGTMASSDTYQLRHLFVRMMLGSLSSCTPGNSYTGSFRGMESTIGGLYAVGTNGEIQFSSSGHYWIKHTTAGAYSGNFRTVFSDYATYVITAGDNAEIQVGSATGADSWVHSSAANSYTGTFYGGCHGFGRFYLVGSAGEIQYSTDNGTTWTHVASGTSNDLHAIVWTGSMYVIVGNSGTVLTSTDGNTWASHSIVTSDNLVSLVWTGTYSVAVAGAGGNYYKSSDGITWSSGSISGSAPNTNSISYSSELGLYVTCHNNSQMYFSFDLSAWYSIYSVSGNESSNFYDVWYSTARRRFFLLGTNGGIQRTLAS